MSGAAESGVVGMRIAPGPTLGGGNGVPPTLYRLKLPALRRDILAAFKLLAAGSAPTLVLAAVVGVERTVEAGESGGLPANDGFFDRKALG